MLDDDKPIVMPRYAKIMHTCITLILLEAKVITHCHQYTVRLALYWSRSLPAAGLLVSLLLLTFLYKQMVI